MTRKILRLQRSIEFTGGLVFIGFNALQLWAKEHPECEYFTVDNETYAAQFMLQEKRAWLKENGIKHLKCDICNEKRVEDFTVKNGIDTIVSFAAETHVDNSISGPDIFFKTNVLGTAALLNIAKKHDLRFHQVSTDEAYGETSPESWISVNAAAPNASKIISTEDYVLKPSSPYSSSKASADLIALSYYRTFGTNVTISRCGNNAGRWQHPEKLIGTVISRALRDEKVHVYGKGIQKRYWIDVDDHNRAIFKIFSDSDIGKIYNIGPTEENYITNMQLIKIILRCLKKPMSLVEHVTDRLWHDTTYFLHQTEEFQTRCVKDFMPEVVEWYKENLK